MNAQHLKLIPRMSEKSYGQSLQNVYVFTVPVTANKQQVADAVAEQFKVKVTTVNIVKQKGKAIRSVRKGKAVPGKRADSKKAYVRLAEGSRLSFFDEEEKK